MAEIEKALGLEPSGTVRIRYTGTQAITQPEFGEIKPGVFECPRGLAEKLLEAGKKTGDYVPADEEPLTSAEAAEVLEKSISAWPEPTAPSGRKKE